MTAQIIFSLVTFLVFPITLFNFLITKVDFINLKPFVVVSGSMEPEIPVGSLIYVVKNTSYATGDILTFRMGGEYVSHRLVKTVTLGNQVYYSTKGDANAVFDEALILPHEVVGRVHAILPALGNLTIFYKSSWGLIVGVTIPLYILITTLNRKRTYSH